MHHRASHVQLCTACWPLGMLQIVELQFFSFSLCPLIPKCQLHKLTSRPTGPQDLKILLLCQPSPVLYTHPPDLLRFQPDLLRFQPDLLRFQPDLLRFQPDLLRFQPDLVRFDQFQEAMSHNLDIICYNFIKLLSQHKTVLSNIEWFLGQVVKRCAKVWAQETEWSRDIHLWIPDHMPY